MDEQHTVAAMNARAQALARRLGKPFANGIEKVDAEISLAEDRTISVCLDGGFLLVENLDSSEEEDVNMLQFETERAPLDFLSEVGGHRN